MAGIVSDAHAGLADLVGVHGGDGTLRWKRLGTGNTHVVPECGHWVAEEQPAHFGVRLGDFLAA
jgi:pimeloyl-ACP methyl ester carboxylesterase